MFQETECNGVKFWCYNAGHVLGAAMFMIEIAGVKVLGCLVSPLTCDSLARLHWWFVFRYYTLEISHAKRIGI